jgi:hypothetical protein
VLQDWLEVPKTARRDYWAWERPASGPAASASFGSIYLGLYLLDGQNHLNLTHPYCVLSIRALESSRSNHGLGVTIATKEHQ